MVYDIYRTVLGTFDYINLHFYYFSGIMTRNNWLNYAFLVIKIQKKQKKQKKHVRGVSHSGIGDLRNSNYVMT